MDMEKEIKCKITNVCKCGNEMEPLIYLDKDSGDVKESDTVNICYRCGVTDQH